MLQNTNRSYRVTNLIRGGCCVPVTDRRRVLPPLAQSHRANSISLGCTDLPAAITKYGHSMAGRRMAPPMAQIRQPPPGGASWQPAHQGFRVFGVAGDGSCMFRAIVQGAQIAGRGTYGGVFGPEWKACFRSLVMFIEHSPVQ